MLRKSYGCRLFRLFLTTDPKMLKKKKRDEVSSMLEVRESSFISLMSSVFFYHSGLFICAVKR